jgi:hypothetical protein
MVLLGNLHLYYEPVSDAVRAVEVEHGCTLLTGLVYLLVWEQEYVHDFCLQKFP